MTQFNPFPNDPPQDRPPGRPPAPLAGTPAEEPILAEVAPELMPWINTGEPAVRSGATNAYQPESAITASELAEHRAAGRSGLHLSIASWFPALAVFVAGPVVLFLQARGVGTPSLWSVLPLAGLLGLGLVVLIVATYWLPPPRRETGRGGAIACLVIGYSLFTLAVGLVLFCALAVTGLRQVRLALAAQNTAQNQAAPPAKPLPLTPEQQASLNQKRLELRAQQDLVTQLQNEEAGVVAARDQSRLSREEMSRNAARKKAIADAARAAALRQQEEQRKQQDKP